MPATDNPKSRFIRSPQARLKTRLYGLLLRQRVRDVSTGRGGWTAAATAATTTGTSTTCGLRFRSIRGSSSRGGRWSTEARRKESCTSRNREHDELTTSDFIGRRHASDPV